MVSLNDFISKETNNAVGYYTILDASFLIIDNVIVYLEIPEYMIKYTTNSEVFAALNREVYYWPQNIEGPVSFSRHESSEYGKIIYIFGDIHSVTKKSCQNNQRIDDFFKTIIDTNLHKTVDIFLEHYLGVGKIDKNITRPKDIYPSLIMETWKDCLKREKSGCPKNVRFHYADARHYTTTILRYISSINKTIAYIPTLINGGTRGYFDKEYQFVVGNKDTMISFFSNIDDDKFSKIRKQLDNVPEKKVVQILERLIDNGKKLAIDNIHTIVKAYNLANDGMNSLPIDTSKLKLAYATLKISRLELTTGWIMDAYLIARMFRQYQDGSQHKYIIIYAGDIHCLIYRRILKGLQFKTTHSYENEHDTQCVDISPLPKYFF